MGGINKTLKPCPFCGSAAKMYGGYEAQETCSVWCQNTDGPRHHISTGTMDEGRAAEVWNRRSDVADAMAAQIEAIAASIEWKYNDVQTLPDGAQELTWAHDEVRAAIPTDAVAALAERDRQIRLRALEEAAKVCDDLETKSNRPSRCAAAIRALGEA